MEGRGPQQTATENSAHVVRDGGEYGDAIQRVTVKSRINLDAAMAPGTN